jgi:hypothetical protein
MLVEEVGNKGKVELRVPRDDVCRSDVLVAAQRRRSGEDHSCTDALCDYGNALSVQVRYDSGNESKQHPCEMLATWVSPTS